MAPLEIVVRGRARGRYRPERATLHLSVRIEGPEKPEVRTRAVVVQSELITTLDALRNDGALTTWSSDSIRVYSYRPHDRDGRRLDPVYTTTIALDAEFTDFEMLSGFIDDWSDRDGVQVGQIAWDVTDDHRLDHERDLRRQAVEDAVAKAQAYADAVGRGTVVATQLADPNMLAESSPAQPMMMRAMVGDDGAGPPSLELRSDDIEIVVAVDARFVAE